MTLWGGRFSEGPAEAVFALSRSTHFDWRLAPYDLRSSLTHLSGLESVGLISTSDATAIRNALKEIVKEVSEGSFVPALSDEDVHSALERRLTEKLGDLGGALRAGRSRNDQVATDLKLLALDYMLHIGDLLMNLQEAILAKSIEYVDVPSPGFTHLQHAQPVTLGHEISKHAHSLMRDITRIRDWQARTSTSPLGAGALSGASLGIDTNVSATELGFLSAVANSIDAVSDRDFVAEALFILALVGVHLSRLSEEWTLWCTSEFGWANVSDAYSTGSSIMPQKKNPDVAELARGKSGRLIGNLTNVLVMLKGLPFAYNRDLQEDKEPFFDSLDTLTLVLPPLTGMIATTSFNSAHISSTAPQGFSLATEIADFLVKAGVPFAKAHEAAGECVRVCEAKNLELHELSNEQFEEIHPSLTAKVRETLSVEGALRSRTATGGTAPAEVRNQIAKLQLEIKAQRAYFASEGVRFSGMMNL